VAGLTMKKRDLEVAILAGGNSTRFRTEKALAVFRGKPLVTHMIGIARQLSDLCTVVVSNDEQADRLKSAIFESQVVVDPKDAPRCALTGALTAFEYSRAKYVLLLPVDTPLASVSLLDIIADLGPGHGAVVPIWPSGYIEPLHAVYLSEHAYANGLGLVDSGRSRMQDLLDSLRHVLYISTSALEQFDRGLQTFTNMNTEEDLREAEKQLTKIG
jgi:molybdopterin-guanine dinucleotide biosynthesis protein A